MKKYSIGGLFECCQKNIECGQLSETKVFKMEIFIIKKPFYLLKSSLIFYNIKSTSFFKMTRINGIEFPLFVYRCDSKGNDQRTEEQKRCNWIHLYIYNWNLVQEKTDVYEEVDALYSIWKAMMEDDIKATFGEQISRGIQREIINRKNILIGHILKIERRNHKFDYKHSYEEATKLDSAVDKLLRIEFISLNK